MSVRALDHVNIATDKLTETRDFFVNVVGLVEGFRPDVPLPGYWLYAGDRPVLHLGHRARPMASTENNAVSHFALEVADLAAVADKLRKMDVPFIERSFDRAGIRQIVVTDPNGVMVELNSGRY